MIFIRSVTKLQHIIMKLYLIFFLRMLAEFSIHSFTELYFYGTQFYFDVCI